MNALVSMARPAYAITALVLRRWLWLPILLACFYALYFSPALLKGLLLAPGDGEIYYVPSFGLSPLDLWNDDLLAGYPVVSDIQAQTFYPLRWLAPTFNILVISAYVVSALGAFGLAYTLTRSRLSALLAAMVCSGSGFLIGHLGHLSIIHAAAWIPALLWAVASLRTTSHWGTVAAGALATGLTLLGGHPQISVIGLLLAGFFAVHEIAAELAGKGWRAGLHMLGKVTALFALGLLLAAPSLVATLGSAGDSVRASWSINDFGSFSHTWETLRILVFPNLYGANGAGPYGAYTGPWNMTELAMYAGLLPWMLALAAIAGWRANRSHWFWVVALVIALVLSTGITTSLGTSLFDLPILGRFRAQARFGLVVEIALSVLAAYGMSAILRGNWERRRRLAVGTAIVVVLFGGIAAAVALGAGDFRAAIYVPLLMLLLSAAAMLVLLRRPGFHTALLAIVLVVIDLGSFGWFYEWRYGATPSRPPGLEASTQALVDELAQDNGRVLPLSAQHMGINPLRPNVNLQYSIATVVGYGPLLSARYAAYTGADTTGGFGIVAPDAPVLDVLAVRWLAGIDQATLEPQLLGQGCGASGNLRTVRATLPADMVPAEIRLVSHMGCSQAVPNAAAIADVQLLDNAGSVLTAVTLDAGEETAEWAYDRADVRATVAHARPPVAESFDAGNVQGLWFDARWRLAVPPSARARHVQITLRDAGAILRVKSLQVKPAGAGAEVQLPLAPIYDFALTGLGPARTVPALPPLRERLGFIGRYWGVCEVRPIESPGLAALLASASAARSAGFDPRKVALIETGMPLPTLGCRVPPQVRNGRAGHGMRELEVASQGKGLLVVSDSYNSGWRATIDGKSVPVIPVDGLVLGVEIPDGKHRVVLRYWPPYFRLCAVLAAMALAAIAALSLGAVRRMRA